MIVLFLAAQVLTGELLAGDFLTLMRKAESRSGADEQIEYYTRALRAWTPMDGQALLANCHFRRGEALFVRGQTQAALPDLDKALGLDPRNSQAYLLRGKARMAQRRYKQAAADLSEYAALAPEDMEGLLALGSAQRQTAELEAALATYRRAALLEPADFRPPLGAGMTYMALKQWRSAKDFLDEADNLARHRDPTTLVERGATKAALGDRPAALEDYGAAMPLHEARLASMIRSGAPKDEIASQQNQTAQAYYGRGSLYEALREESRARDDYEQACKLGHEAGCLKGAKAPAAARSSAPARQRRRAIPVDSGDRIYAN